MGTFGEEEEVDAVSRMVRTMETHEVTATPVRSAKTSEVGVDARKAVEPLPTVREGVGTCLEGRVVMVSRTTTGSTSTKAAVVTPVGKVETSEDGEKGGREAMGVLWRVR